MTGFDFAFALFTLVLGLAVGENVSGFARVMRLHARARAGKADGVRVGWLTPLLAVLVLLNQITLWHQGYAVRNGLPFSYLTLLIILAIVVAHYLFSSLVWPEDPAEWPDFDAYYEQHNRLILSGLLIINIAVMLTAQPYAPGPTAAQEAAMGSEANFIASIALLSAFVLMLALIFVKSRVLNALLLVLVIAAILGGAITIAMLGLTPV